VISAPTPDGPAPPGEPGLGRSTALDRLARRAGLRVLETRALPGDLTHRRYLRLHLEGNARVIAVVYPEGDADTRRRWVAARDWLAERRVRVPRLLEDDGAGCQILEDLGEEDLAQRLAARPEEREAWLSRAVEAAAAIAAAADPHLNPPFDAAFFRRELDLAREAVFDLWLESPLDADARRRHDRWADALCTDIDGHPRVLCHRDYHANNLFPAGREVAAIDFQDLRTGPDAYDLASLLWERTTLSWMTPDLAQAAVEQAAQARGVEVAPFAARLDRVLLQRAWKVCGTFARAVAQGRGPVYREYLPGQLRLVARLLSRPEDADFERVFEARMRRFL
jgi:aminoglycoside/choline kinase family phosphotransferase